MDSLDDADVGETFQAIGLRVFVVEDAVREVLHLSAKVVSVLEAFVILLLPNDGEVLQRFAVHVAGVELKRTLCTGDQVGIKLVAEVRDGELGKPPLREAQGDADCVVEVAEACFGVAHAGSEGFERLVLEEVADGH